MASATTICADALTLVGAQPIDTLSDDNDRARLASLFYTPTLDELLEAGDWSFAKLRVALTELTATPLQSGEWDLAHQFALPTDPYCLHVIETDLTSGTPYRIERYDNGAGTTARVLLTTESAVSILYLARVTDVSVFTPLFRMALTYTLAWKFAYPLTRNATLVDFYERKSQAMLQTAKSRASQEGRPMKTWLSNTLTAGRASTHAFDLWPNP